MPKRQPSASKQRPLFRDSSRRLSMIDVQTIFCGDNLELLTQFADESVDLIYIDPPFNSNRVYETFWGETKEKRAFEDRHESTNAYINYMLPRCRELARVLKKTGSFYCHCDWHASHYVKVMLDQIFGENGFRSEIIWRRNAAKGLAFKGFPNNHDSIFYYTASEEFTWNRPFLPYDSENLDEKTAKKYCHKDPDGRVYRLSDLNNPNRNRPNLTYEFLGVTRVWRWTKERMQAAYEAGLVVQTKPGTVPQLKRYLDEQAGRPIDDVWTDISPINSQAIERVGFPTQKPLALLERIIKASSNPDDIVLDAFCGCGTALVAAQRLGRRWIGIDSSPTACRVMADRLRKDCNLRQDMDFEVHGLPRNVDELRRMPPFEFQNWAVVALGGIPNKRKTGDKGIDGRFYPVASESKKDVSESGEFEFMKWYPVQVKQRDKAGRPDIDAFETAIQREGKDKGIFVSFDYTADAQAEIRAFFKRTGCVIVPLTVRELTEMDETELAMKLA